MGTLTVPPTPALFLRAMCPYLRLSRLPGSNLRRWPDHSGQLPIRRQKKDARFVERIYGMKGTGSNAFAYSGTYFLDSLSSTLNRIGPGSLAINASRIDPDRIFLSTTAGLESVHKVKGQKGQVNIGAAA
jgi:hypothetical protein